MITYSNKRVLVSIEAENDTHRLAGSIFSDFEDQDNFERVYADILVKDEDIKTFIELERARIYIFKPQDKFIYRIDPIGNYEIEADIVSLVKDVIAEISETYKVNIEEFVEMPEEHVHEHACECGCEDSTKCECEECHCEECK